MRVEEQEKKLRGRREVARKVRGVGEEKGGSAERGKAASWRSANESSFVNHLRLPRCHATPPLTRAILISCKRRDEDKVDHNAVGTVLLGRVAISVPVRAARTPQTKQRSNEASRTRTKRRGGSSRRLDLLPQPRKLARGAIRLKSPLFWLLRSPWTARTARQRQSRAPPLPPHRQSRTMSLPHELLVRVIHLATPPPGPSTKDERKRRRHLRR